MPCYHPLSGFRTATGQITWVERKQFGECAPITVACGQCIGCRLERSRTWAMRCVHETKMYKNNCFITLTYNDEQLPHRGQLTYKHFVDFMKRLRKKYGENIRFYMAGEYGSINQRPHYHAILFNHDWDDKMYHKTTGSGEKIYTSTALERLWKHGYSSTAEATFESAAYIARYCMAKRTGDEAEEWYKRTDPETGETYQQIPEFNQASRRPGIGGDWYNFFKKEVQQSDSIIIRGKESNIPAYYDKLLKRLDERKMQQFKEEREWKAYQSRADNTPERMAVKEIVAEAKLNLLVRGEI